jgi:hypothetical protein
MTARHTQGLLYDDAIPSRTDSRRDARKQAQAGAERSRADSDQRNGALLRTDSRLARLFKAYTVLDEPGREQFVARAVASEAHP